MPEKKTNQKETPVQKWRMALTDSARFAERMVESDMTAMTTAWESNPKDDPQPTAMTRTAYADAADAHRAIAAVCAARNDTTGAKQHDRHMAVAALMCDIATAAWTPAKADAKAKADAAAAAAKADAVAAIMEQMKAAGLTVDDINTQ